MVWMKSRHAVRIITVNNKNTQSPLRAVEQKCI